MQICLHHSTGFVVMTTITFPPSPCRRCAMIIIPVFRISVLTQTSSVFGPQSYSWQVRGHLFSVFTSLLQVFFFCFFPPITFPMAGSGDELTLPRWGQGSESKTPGCDVTFTFIFVVQQNHSAACSGHLICVFFWLHLTYLGSVSPDVSLYGD